MCKDVNINWPMCDLATSKTLQHRFYKCPRVKLAWTHAAIITFRLKHPLYLEGKMRRLDIM
jgi:hypothetical protein